MGRGNGVIDADWRLCSPASLWAILKKHSSRVKRGL